MILLFIIIYILSITFNLPITTTTTVQATIVDADDECTIDTLTNDYAIRCILKNFKKNKKKSKTR